MLYQLDEHARSLAKAFRNAGGLVEVDGDTFDERTQEFLPLVDVFIMSEYYYLSCFPDSDICNVGQLERNLKTICSYGPRITVVTLGAKGCAGVENGHYFRTDAYQVDAKDTTGAGDVFHGAFVFGLSCGKSAEESAQFAGAVSAVKCTMLGGRTGIPTLNCVEHFMVTGEIEFEDFAKREEYYRNCMWEA